MSTRHPRSPSIPVRGAVPPSPARHIESVISIPFPTSPSQSRGPRTASQGWPPRNSPGTIGIPHGIRGNSSVTSSPPTRPTSRSFSHSSALSARGSASPYIVYEPRVIRTNSTRMTDPICPHNSSSSSGSPSRTRRPSSTGIGTRSAQRPSVAHSSAPPEAAPFPRPAYLEHSALRHLLQTESSSLLPPRKTESIVRQEPMGARRMQRSPSYDSDEDDMSPPRDSRKRTLSPMTVSSLTLSLPTRWCNEYRSPHLTVCGDGRELIYQASGGSDKDAATARTAVPVPPACGIFYYEVDITSKASKSRISVGFITRDVKVSRLPGWEKNSWGYHGESGTICSGDKNGLPFGTTFGVGDIIGCGIDFTQNKVFYTKNGSLLGTVFENVGKDCDVFPAVGLCYTNESIHANFGQGTFKYDIEDHVLQQRNHTWAKIQSTPLRWPTEKPRSHDASASGNIAGSVADPSDKVPLNDLVLSYLSHHGYARTTRAFESQCHARGGLSARAPSVTSAPEHMTVTPTSTDDYVMDMDIGDASPSWPAVLAPIPADDIELRSHIIQSIVSGDVDTALTATRKHFPLALQADAGLMLFKLRCRKFVELVLEAADLKKKMTAEEDEMNVGSCGPVSRSVSGSALESVSEDTVGSDGGVMVDGVGMDIDDGEAEVDTSDVRAHTEMNMPTRSAPIAIGPSRKPSVVSLSSTSSWAGATAARYGSALERAVAYGQDLESDYKNRAEVRAIFKRTSVIMAYDDPLEAGGDAAEVAGQAARVALATELNQAILQSQGRPAQPLLDRLYRQTAVCLTQLALMGNGAAAFADMPKEFLDA